MERRVLFAVVLSMIFFIIWQNIFIKPKITQNLPVSQTIDTSKKQENKTDLFEPFEINTKNIKVVFNKFGAGIREIYIKEKNNEDNQFNLFCKSDLDSLYNFPEVLYKAESYEENNILKVKFTGQMLEQKNKKVTIVKTYEFEKTNVDNINSFWTKVNIETSEPKYIEFKWQHYIYTDKYTTEPNATYIGLKTKLEDKETIIVKKISNQKIETKELSWAAISAKYFLLAFFPEDNINSKLSIENLNKTTKSFLFQTPLDINRYSFKLLLTPKSVSILKDTGYKLNQTIEWGTFSPLSKIFYEILLFFYKKTGNYGIAIIGLTILLQIISFPLTYKSLKSTIHLKQIQPQIQTLQKVYKDDPKRLNIEIMNLYKEKKVNPFGGCLPLLLQIPIFWALFTMLRNTYDLRGASFILWIKDLSQPDKFIIPKLNISFPLLPILMGVSMLLQQLLSGSSNDPNQKMFTYFLPIMFTVMFINFPSGLVLYWFINNIFTLIIQLSISKKLR